MIKVQYQQVNSLEKRQIMNSPDPEIKSKFDMSSIKYPDRIFAALFLKQSEISFSTTNGSLRRFNRRSCSTLTEEVFFNFYRFLKTAVSFDFYSGHCLPALPDVLLLRNFR